MLGSMSQTAMLNVKGKRVKLDRLKGVVKLFLSTSPNLVLIASLDVARYASIVVKPRETFMSRSTSVFFSFCVRPRSAALFLAK